MGLSAEEDALLGAFYQQVTKDKPLDPGSDARYVPLYENAGQDDPVDLMHRGIRWRSGDSVQLLSGFRGTGKSTELRRLRNRLRQAGYLVALVDMEDYVNMSTTVDVSDFLMTVAGAFSDALAAQDLLGKDPKHEGWWSRLGAFLVRTRIEVPDVSESGIKVALKSDPTFKQRLQEHVSGHLGTLTEAVHGFFRDTVALLKKRHASHPDVVFLVDSMEHLRGASAKDDLQVQASVVNLFAGHSAKLTLPDIHVIYTVPPYLKVLSPNIGMFYGTGAVKVFPAVKLRDRATRDVQKKGLTALRRVLEFRGPIGRLVNDDALLDQLILASGGHLRDLFRLVAEVMLRAQSVPVDANVVNGGIRAIRAEFLPIADEQARWLSEIAETRKARLGDLKHVADLAWFLDTHVVLCFRNGEDEWYDVHPLIREVVIDQTRELNEAPRSSL